MSEPSIDEYTTLVALEVISAFRHDALNRIDFLSLHLSRASDALDRNHAREARESIAEIDDELRHLARAVNALRMLSAHSPRSAQPLTDVWESLVAVLAEHGRRAGVELELRRHDGFDPYVPAPVTHALITAATMGLNAAVDTHRRHSRLVVEAESSGDGHARLRVQFPLPVGRSHEVTLALRVVTALLAGCNGHCSVPEDDQVVDLRMTFPIETVNQ